MTQIKSIRLIRIKIKVDMINKIKTNNKTESNFLVKNPTIKINSIRKKLKKIKVLTADEIGINSQAIEAQAFAYMGYLTLKGHALGGPWTGSKVNSPPGLIVPGVNWNSLLRKLNTHS